MTLIFILLDKHQVQVCNRYWTSRYSTILHRNFFFLGDTFFLSMFRVNILTGVQFLHHFTKRLTGQVIKRLNLWNFTKHRKSNRCFHI